MKVIINIGGASYLSGSAASAAKIADLLGNLTPLKSEWAADRNGRENYHLVRSDAERDSRVSITSVGDRQVFASDAEFEAWRATELQLSEASKAGERSLPAASEEGGAQ